MPSAIPPASRDVAVPQPTVQDEQLALSWADEGVVAPPPLPVPRSAAVEFEARVSPAGDLIVVAGRQHLSVRQGMAGRTLTVWADRTSGFGCDPVLPARL